MNGKSPVGRPRTKWLDYIENLGNRLRLRPSKMHSVLLDQLRVVGSRSVAT